MMQRIILTLMVILLIAATQAASKPPDVEAETEEVLNLLLPASTMTIPPQSSCQGLYRYQQGKPKVKDLLAMELAGFSGGKNTIVGSCKGEPKSCVLRIRHAYGEDVYSADIRFSVHEGAVDISTLSCIMTP